MNAAIRGLICAPVSSVDRSAAATNGTRHSRRGHLGGARALMDVYSLANQSHLKYPDLSTSENERLHPQCGLYMTILSSYPYVS